MSLAARARSLLWIVAAFGADMHVASPVHAMDRAAAARRLPDALVSQGIERDMGAARTARDGSRFDDCIMAASSAQEIAQAYRGFLNEKSQIALDLVTRCAARIGNTEMVSSVLKQRYATAAAEFGEFDPHVLQSLRSLALFETLEGDATQGQQLQLLYLDRLAKSVGQYDPRYPAALYILDLGYAGSPGADGRRSAAVAGLERARQAFRLEKAIFGARHPIVADGLGWWAERYHSWIDAQEIENPVAERRSRKRADGLLRRAFGMARRLRGDEAIETLTLASALAEHVQPDEHRALLAFVAAGTARRDGPNHPATLMAEFDVAMARDAEDKKRTALRAIADRAIALDDAGSPFGLYMFKVLEARFELLDETKPGQPSEWPVIVDQLMGAAQRLSIRSEGHANLTLLQRQLRYRSRHPSLNAGVGEIADRLFRAMGDKQRGEGELSDAGTRAQEEALAPAYRLVAQTIWANGRKTPHMNFDDAELAFAALQNALSGTTSAALARAAARTAAGSVSDDLRQLVDMREGLREELQEMDRRFTANVRTRTTGAGGFDGPGFMAKRRDLASVNARLEREFPAYFAFIQPEPLAIAEARRLLSPDEALVMFVPDGDRTHVFAVNADGYKWIMATHARPGLQRQVQRLLWDLGAGIRLDPQTENRWYAEDGGRFPYHRGIAWQVYRELMEPVADILKGRQHLFLVQGGVLSGLPMGVLVTRQPEGDDADSDALRNTSWFADEHAITILPSVQSLALLRGPGAGRNRPGTGPRRFIGFGDPALSGAAQTRGIKQAAFPLAADLYRLGRTRSSGGEIDVTRLRSLSRLPGTALELADMAKLFGAGRSTLFLEDAATESHLKHIPLDGASVIAFATHGVLAGEIGGTTEPGLILTPPAQPSGDDDGFLSSSEVASLRMNADWVILSACNTAGDDGLEGAPGLTGLARSFLYAGARSLLVSHWPVRDDIAPRLTVDSIRRQRSGMSLNAAHALAASMREVRNDKSKDGTSETFAHPNAWAPFSLIGDPTLVGDGR